MVKKPHAGRSLVHVIADCKVCGKHWEDYRAGRKAAAEHARRTGHRVIVDLGYVIEYGTTRGRKR